MLRPLDMADDDILNKAAANKFAWRALKSSDLESLLEEAKPPPSKPKSAASPSEKDEEPPERPAGPGEDSALNAEQLAYRQREQWEANKEACRKLSNEVLYIWRQDTLEEQARHIPALAETVQKMMFELAWMCHFPVAALRLWRLFVRHRKCLRREERNQTFHTLRFMALPEHHKELVELFASVAEQGLSVPAYVLEEHLTDPLIRRYPELGERLMLIYEQAVEIHVREVAISFIAKLPLSQSGPCLHKALYSDVARIRWAALTGLLEKDPKAIDAGALQWLLEDAVVHPFPRKRGKNAYALIKGYSASLLSAVEKNPPPRGYEPLLKIVMGEGEYIDRERHGLTEEWALCALAAAYPEWALSATDERMQHANMWKRYHAIDALWYLPEPYARPRFEVLAGDIIHQIAERAKHFYFHRFHEECLPSPLKCLDGDLLVEPPRDVFWSRLLILKGPSAKARNAIVDTLLEEAAGRSAADELGPRDRETLVLLLACVRDDSTAFHRNADPKTKKAWADLLIRSFGEPAFAKLLALAEAFAGRGYEADWFRPLGELGRDQVLSVSQIEALRGCLHRRIHSPEWPGTCEEIEALRWIGPTGEVLDALWDVALERNRRGPIPKGFPGISASRALVEIKDCPELDARIVLEGTEAFRARRWEDFEKIVHIGCQRKVPGAEALVLECLDVVEQRPLLLMVARKVASSLCFMGGASDAWLLPRLMNPESPRFGVAADLVKRGAPEAQVQLLWEALSSPARKGAAAAEAAEALVSLDLMGIEDQRLGPILEAAPLYARTALVKTLLIWDSPLSPVWEPLISILISDDDESVWDLYQKLRYGEYERRDELFQEVWERGPNEIIKSDLAFFLGEPHAEEEDGSEYFRDHWEDTAAEDEDEEDEDEG